MSLIVLRLNRLLKIIWTPHPKISRNSFAFAATGAILPSGPRPTLQSCGGSGRCRKPSVTPVATAITMRPFDETYRQPSGASPLAEVVERLASAAPADLAEIDLRHYRALQPPWNEWGHVAARGRHWAQVLARVVLEGGTDD